MTISYPGTVFNALEAMVVILFQRLTVYLVFMLCTQVSKHTFLIYTKGCSSELAIFLLVGTHVISDNHHWKLQKQLSEMFRINSKAPIWMSLQPQRTSSLAHVKDTRVHGFSVHRSGVIITLL